MIPQAIKNLVNTETSPTVGGPSWCRTDLVARVRDKAVAEVAALRQWRSEFTTLAQSFAGIEQSTAAGRAEAVLQKLEGATSGEEFAELTGELKLIELGRGPFGGKLRQTAGLIVSRKFAEAGPMIEALVATAEKELSKLAREALDREAKASSALQDLVGEAFSFSPLTEKVEDARQRFESLRTEFNRQHGASLWNGRTTGFLDPVLS